MSTAINLGIDIRIPEDYIYDMSQRLRTYKRIASARSDEDLWRIHEEVADRYGRLPESVENLFTYARVRREAEQLGLISIDRVGESLAIKLSEKAKLEPQKLLQFIKGNNAASFSPNGVLKLKLLANEEEISARVFATLRHFLQAVKA